MPKRLLLLTMLLLSTSCNSQPNKTILLGLTDNSNGKCVGHASGLCGPEREAIRTEVAGVFASEPSCQGLKLRGLTEEERGVPSNKLPLLLQLLYEGTPHASYYMGTGKGEDQGWSLMFNGPKGHFSARVKTERDAVRQVCLAAKGEGGEVDPSVGYTH
jgi:hypothetical protein